jgi:pyruvate ferredoxin oxidoreductase gamma subunit
MLIELRWHSRGGLGALTSARVLAEAVWEFGYWAQAFPEYGPERAGAPMMCYDRLSTQKISLHCGIYEPAIVAVLDPALLATIPVTEGLKPSGILVVNTDTPAPQVVQCLGLQIQATRSRGHRIITLDATAIAQTCQCFKENRPMPNSPILGALLELLGGQQLVEIGQACLVKWFRGDVLKKNSEALTQGAQAVRAGHYLPHPLLRPRSQRPR